MEAIEGEARGPVVVKFEEEEAAAAAAETFEVEGLKVVKEEAKGGEEDEV